MGVITGIFSFLSGLDRPAESRLPERQALSGACVPHVDLACNQKARCTMDSIGSVLTHHCEPRHRFAACVVAATDTRRSFACDARVYPDGACQKGSDQSTLQSGHPAGRHERENPPLLLVRLAAAHADSSSAMNERNERAQLLWLGADGRSVHAIEAHAKLIRRN